MPRRTVPMLLVVLGAALSVQATFAASAAPAPGSAAAAAATSRRAITHEDLWTMRRVGAPVPSPDGRWVVFGVTAAFLATHWAVLHRRAAG